MYCVGVGALMGKFQTELNGIKRIWTELDGLGWNQTESDRNPACAVKIGNLDCFCRLGVYLRAPQARPITDFSGNVLYCTGRVVRVRRSYVG